MGKAFLARCNNFSGGGGAIAYQLGETETGDTWIDGSPIYRYVMTIPVKSSGTTTSTDFNSVGKKIISIVGTYYRNSTNGYFNITNFDAINGNTAYTNNLTIGITGVNFSVGKSIFPGELIAIIEYIKTQ